MNHRPTRQTTMNILPGRTLAWKNLPADQVRGRLPESTGVVQSVLIILVHLSVLSAAKRDSIIFKEFN